MNELIEKYNVPVPRYTSYPTVPNWKAEDFDKHTYLERLKEGFAAANKEGISIYIHLPYCESLCTYCGCNTRITVNHAVEEPYVNAVLKEWSLLSSHFSKKPNIREIHLGGGTPTFFSADNLVRLVEGITSRSNIAPDASFSFEAHPANTTLEHLRRLRAIGFDRLSLGVQDFDPKVQKAINRIQTTDDIKRVVNQARELGYRSINFDLIYGLPFQTLTGVEDAVDKVLEMKPDRIAFYSYAHVPWMKPGQRAYSEKDLPDAKHKLKLFTRGRDLLLAGGYKSTGFDHFALPEDSLYKSYAQGKMHRNFMGFSDLRTPYQIGLGVSSISDIGNAFAQNAKAVEPYIEKIQKGEVPIVKGHLHTGEDSFIRKHILNLTCKHQTSWYCADPDEIRYMRDKYPELIGFRNEGLLELGNDSISITEKGRLFVRQICSVIDRDYDLAISGKYSKGV
jgi:oxygen-independent coproporphyrinogen-3 oxidase